MDTITHHVASITKATLVHLSKFYLILVLCEGLVQRTHFGPLPLATVTMDLFDSTLDGMDSEELYRRFLAGLGHTEGDTDDLFHGLPPLDDEEEEFVPDAPVSAALCRVFSPLRSEMGCIPLLRRPKTGSRR